MDYFIRKDMRRSRAALKDDLVLYSARLHNNGCCSKKIHVPAMMMMTEPQPHILRRDENPADNGLPSFVPSSCFVLEHLATTMTAAPALTLPAELLKPSSQLRQTVLQHLRLLYLIYHRSKNQHRRSQWFRHFSTFRREVSRLCGNLGIDASRGLVEVSDDSVKDGSKKRTTVVTKKTIDLGKQQDRAAARRRALARLRYWIDGGLVVKWYTYVLIIISALPAWSLTLGTCTDRLPLSQPHPPLRL
jgi:hypothetical protein